MRRLFLRRPKTNYHEIYTNNKHISVQYLLLVGTHRNELRVELRRLTHVARELVVGVGVAGIGRAEDCGDAGDRGVTLRRLRRGGRSEDGDGEESGGDLHLGAFLTGKYTASRRGQIDATLLNSTLTTLQVMKAFELFENH